MLVTFPTPVWLTICDNISQMTNMRITHTQELGQDRSSSEIKIWLPGNQDLYFTNLESIAILIASNPANFQVE